MLDLYFFLYGGSTTILRVHGALSMVFFSFSLVFLMRRDNRLLAKNLNKYLFEFITKVSSILDVCSAECLTAIEY